MNEILYLLDENVNPILRSALLRNEPNLTVWQVGMLGAPALGTLDPEILIWCEETGFILVTNNRKSMPVHLEDHLATGRRVTGIIILNAEMSVGETVDELVLIATASSAEEYKTKLSICRLADLYGDVGYTIIDDVLSLRERMPNIYRKLTS